MNSKLRVRQVLDSIGANGRRALAKYLPEYELPTETKGTFPAAILSSYPENKYSEVGVLTEQLVLSSGSNTEPTVQTIMAKLRHVVEGPAKGKIAISKTTADYLAKILATRQYMRNQGIAIETCEFDTEYLGVNVMGHPDGVFNGGAVVAEVKTSSKLDVDHVYFMLQLCMYMALNPAFERGVLILPLQSTCIIVSDWPNRAKLLAEFEQKAAKIIAARPPTVSMEEIFGVAQLIDYYGIGRHIAKNKSLLATVSSMIPGVPFQIFLASNASSRLNLDDADVEAAGQWVRNNNIVLYIHAPYIINLAAECEDEWNIEYMCRTMKYASKLGAKGVVVHVGKFTTQDVEVAEEYMGYAVQTILESTDAACPLLIETPAGQGSEMLCARETFMDFIQMFMPTDPLQTPKIGACVDTCHVFACGHKPSEYVEAVGNAGLLRLVHYNDSNEICGSCKDRHAPVGRGFIGIAEMTAVADYCGANQIHMVIE